MLYQIGDFLKRVRVPVVIEDDKVYRLVTIRMNHKGVVQREEKSGSAIGTKTMYRVTAGQFILSGIDARNGAFGIVPDELDGAVVTNDFWYFEIDNTIISKNYFLYLTSTPLFADIVRKASDGTTNRVRLQADKFYTYKVDLPDVSNQDEVIEKVVQHEVAIRIIQAELQTQQNLLAKLRQSILQEAVQGKLTERWRAERNGLKHAEVGQVAGSNPVGGSANESRTPTENPVTSGGTGSSPVRTANRSDETGAELLARIRAEKAELIRQGKLRKEKPLPSITDAEKPFDLPEGWIWCRLGEISNSIVPNRDKPLSFTGDIPWITQSNFIDNEFALDYSKSDKGLTMSEITKYGARIMPAGSVVMSCVGNFDLVVVLDQDIVANQQLHCFVPLSQVSSFYTAYVIKAFIHLLDKEAIITTIKYINKRKCESLIFPLPPLHEQHTIVAQVEKALTQVSEMEAENRQQQAEIRRLMQSVLREAFAGKEVVEN